MTHNILLEIGLSDKMNAKKNPRYRAGGNIWTAITETSQTLTRRETLRGGDSLSYSSSYIFHTSFFLTQRKKFTPEGIYMSNIPYYFETPVPKYFRENGWLKNPNMAAFLMWVFARCSTEKRVIFHIQKAIELEPFEFVFGRKTCSEETGLTENEIRGCIHQLKDTPIGEILQKTTSKSSNKYSVYKWSLKVFCKHEQQQNHQQSTSRAPAEHHNDKTIRIKTKDIKDDSLGCVENVHNSGPNPIHSKSSFTFPKKISAQAHSSPPDVGKSMSEQFATMNLEDCLETLYKMILPNGLNIQGHVILRWINNYEPHEIAGGLRYFRKMAQKTKLYNPEAYLENILMKRLWEVDKKREEIFQREKLHEKQKKEREESFQKQNEVYI